MKIDEIRRVDREVKSWLSESRKRVLTEMKSRLVVNTKTGRRDLVTNVDKANEHFLVDKIRSYDPGSKILGEEGLGDQVTSSKGQVWIVDPIDGTMNFVKQRNHFAIMIALYENGQGILGYIFDVMGNKLYSGGPDLGVFENDQKISMEKNYSLADGLIGLSGPMVLSNEYNVDEVSRKSLGMRIYGSAGIDIISVLKGELVGYISHLKPWDFGAGKILLETNGFKISSIDGQPLDMLSSTTVLLGTPNAHRDVLTIVSQ